MSSNNLNMDNPNNHLERKMSELNNKFNHFALQNTELHKKTGRKINRLMRLIVNKKKSKSEGTPGYLVIVIIVSVIAIGVIGFLAYKHFSGKKLNVPQVMDKETIKSVTDSI